MGKNLFFFFASGTMGSSSNMHVVVNKEKIVIRGKMDGESNRVKTFFHAWPVFNLALEGY